MSEFGKGIPLASGFDLGAKIPLDSRIVVETIADRDAHVTGNRAYEGMRVYVIENKKNYQYIDSEWRETDIGGDVDLSEYATKDELFSKDYNDLTNKPTIPSVDGLATETYVKNAIANAQLGGEDGSNIDLSGFATKDDLFSKDYNDLINKPTIPSIEGLATETYVKNEIANAQLGGGEGSNIDLSGYATKDDLDEKANISDIPTRTSQLTNDNNFITEIPSEYITEIELNNMGYLTEHQDISHLANRDELFSKDYNDLTNKPTIPSKDIVDQITQENIDKWNNAKGMTDEEKEQLETNTDNILKIMEIIDEPPTYVRPTVSLSISKTIIEHNISTSIVLTPNFNQNDAGSLQNYVLRRDNQILYEGSLQAYTDTIELIHNDTATYTATVTYADGIIKNTSLGVAYPNTSIKAGNTSSSASIRAYAPSYYGVINNSTITVSDIPNLTKVINTSRSNTMLLSLTQQRVVFMYPRSFGNISSIKDSNNFEYINSYTLSTMTYNNVEYNVYILTDAVTINGFRQTFN